MARPNLSIDDIAAFRARIVETAMGLLAGGDARALSFRSLGRALGCSHATPYRYFANKAEVLAAVRAEGFRRFADFLQARLVGVTDPAERIRAVAQGYFEFARDEGAAFRVMFTQRAPDHGPPKNLVDAKVAWDVVLGVIGEAKQAGLIKGSVDRSAHVFWAAVHGITMLEGSDKLHMGRSAAVLLDDIIESMIVAPAAANASSPTTALENS